MDIKTDETDETMVLSRKGKDGINYDGIIKEN